MSGEDRADLNPTHSPAPASEAETEEVTAETTCAAAEEQSSAACGAQGEDAWDEKAANTEAATAADPDSLEAEFAQVVADSQAGELEKQVAQLQDELAHRNADLYNLQQTHNNYVKRAKTEAAAARQLAAQDVVASLLPVLDEIELARKHGDLESGPFKVIAEKLESILAQRYELVRYGEVGETFDPNFHEALMAVADPQVSEPLIKEVVQPGYRLGERVVRAARVMVANPQ